jgi:hypothetical protein
MQGSVVSRLASVTFMADSLELPVMLGIFWAVPDNIFLSSRIAVHPRQKYPGIHTTPRLRGPGFHVYSRSTFTQVFFAKHKIGTITMATPPPVPTGPRLQALMARSNVDMDNIVKLSQPVFVEIIADPTFEFDEKDQFYLVSEYRTAKKASVGEQDDDKKKEPQRCKRKTPKTNTDTKKVKTAGITNTVAASPNRKKAKNIGSTKPGTATCNSKKAAQSTATKTVASKASKGKSDPDDCWWKTEPIPSFDDVWKTLVHLGYYKSGDCYHLPEGTLICPKEPVFKSSVGLRKFLCRYGIPNYTEAKLDPGEITRLQRWVRFAYVPVSKSNSVDVLGPICLSKTITQLKHLLVDNSFTLYDGNIFVPRYETLPGGRRFGNGSWKEYTHYYREEDLSKLYGLIRGGQVLDLSGAKQKVLPLRLTAATYLVELPDFSDFSKLPDDKKELDTLEALGDEEDMAQDARLSQDGHSPVSGDHSSKEAGSILCFLMSYPSVVNAIAAIAERRPAQPPVSLTNTVQSVALAVECVEKDIMSRQQARDFARLVATERCCGVRACTVGLSDQKVDTERHLTGNMKKGVSLASDIAKKWPSIRFRQIILDYFRIPKGWLRERIGGREFVTLLECFPDLLERDGRVYLPFSIDLYECIVAWEMVLKKCYTISYLDADAAAAECALVQGTDTIDTNTMGFLGMPSDGDLAAYTSIDSRAILQQDFSFSHVRAMSSHFKKIGNGESIRMIRLVLHHKVKNEVNTI